MPEPRRSGPATDEAAGEDDFSFLRADEAVLNGLPDESDDVYCDFGVLFGKTQALRPEGARRLADEVVDGPDELAWLPR